MDINIYIYMYIYVYMYIYIYGVFIMWMEIILHHLGWLNPLKSWDSHRFQPVMRISPPSTVSPYQPISIPLLDPWPLSGKVQKNIPHDTKLYPSRTS